MITQISYNVLIERFKAFAAGHYLIEGFTHGHPSAIDIQKDITFPWMHVFPIEVEPRAGSRLYSFIITFADLPRDKETPAEYQREVISDCIKLAEDFVAEVQNGLVLFGPTVELEGSPSIEVFIDEYSQTLTGVNLAVTLSVPWDWSACDIPADFAVGGSGSGGAGAGGGGIVLKTNGVLNGSQSILDLVAGTNITLSDNGSGVVTITASGGGGGGSGTVTSAALSMPSGFAVSGSPITTAGTFAVTGAGDASEYIDGAGDLQTFPTLAAVATSGDYNDLFNLPTINAGTVTSVGLTSATGGVTIGGSPVTTSGNLTLAINTATAAQNGLLSSSDFATFAGKQNAIGLTTVGTNLATLPNPSAVRYLRINAGNDVSALTLDQLKTDLGLAVGGGRAVLPTDFTTVGTAFQNVTALGFSVTAGKTYKWRATILMVANVATNGTLSTFGPSGTSTYRFTGGLGVSTNNINNGNGNNQTNNQAISVSLRMATADGIYIATASGTVGISVISTVAAAITLKAGSVIEYDEVI